MTRLSEYLLPTEKQAPADAEATSHRLMVRAGLVRQMGAGMWTWLPAGWRVHQRVVEIIREEMDAIGAQEMLMPVLQPAEPWRRTGRLEIEELFKLTDRKGSELVLAMTHEEAVTFHIAQAVRSWRDLPLIVYHFQVKERDEPRPRAGVLRTREFIMKDAYSFDRDQAAMEQNYALHVGAYDRMMDRTGLRWYRVEGDVGMMGGLGAHEYMAPCAAGEDEVVLAGAGDQYAANVEVALATPGVEKVGEEYRKDGEPLTLEPAIEIANIFKLGTRYSEPLGATYIDETGAELPIWMASYGIGPARIVAAAVEQFADEHGISWPRALAPFAVHLLALGKPGTPEREAADELYTTLVEGGIDVLYDDRDLGPGEKFAEAELLGCPLRLTVGRRSLESGEVEVQIRRGRRAAPGLPLNGEPAELLRAVDELWRSLP
jgi:prolyl-tRNA synthetase